METNKSAKMAGYLTRHDCDGLAEADEVAWSSKSCRNRRNGYKSNSKLVRTVGFLVRGAGMAVCCSGLECCPWSDKTEAQHGLQAAEDAEHAPSRDGS